MKMSHALRIVTLIALALLLCPRTAHALARKAVRKTIPAAKTRPAAPITKATPTAPPRTTTPAATEPAKTEPAAEEVLPPSPASYKDGGEPEGFRDHKWGTAFSDFTGLKDGGGSTLGGQKVTSYTKDGDDLEFGSIKAEIIRYMFVDEKFYGASIDYSEIKDEQWDAIVRSLQDQFGTVPELLQNGMPTYIWWGEKSFVRMNRSSDSIHLNIWSRFFFPGPDSDKDIFDRAVELGDMPRVKKMLKSNPLLIKQADDDGTCPLHWTLNCHPAKGPTDILKFLLEQGADVAVKAKDGTTPLGRAATLGGLDAVKLLMDYGADVNQKGWSGETALMSAGYYHSDVCEYLVSNGADVNVRGYNGKTPLHDAAQGGKDDLLKIEIEKGADVNAKDNDGWSPLHEACTMLGNEQCVKLLIEHGADVNARESKDGRSPLHIAVDEFRDDAVKLLLDNKADVNAKDNKGLTPLTYAKDDDLQGTIKLLEEHGGTE